MNLEKMKDIPKAELHRHLELCVRKSTIMELAPHIGIELTSDADYEERFLIKGPMNDLGAVLNKFLDTQKLLSSSEILERITFEACEDAYKLENIRVLELRYAPTFVAQGHSLNFEQIHQAICRGVRRAEETYPMAVGLICIIQRILPVKDAEAVTEFAIDHKDSFVGLDLADNEVGFDSKPFASFFLKAKAAGLGITVHSGEADVPKAPTYVRDAIDFLGATRIGHGVQIYKDESMINYVIEKGVVLELCPTSNYLTNAITEIKKHPFKKLMEMGVRTTINTDDPGIFGIDLNHEYDVVHSELGVSTDDLKTCAQWAAESSFIPLEKRQKVWPSL